MNSSLQYATEKIKALAKTKLWLKVIIGLMLGIILGLLLGPEADFIDKKTSSVITEWLAMPGKLFLQLDKKLMNI